MARQPRLAAQRAQSALLRRRALPWLIGAAALVLAVFGFLGGNLLNSLNGPNEPTASASLGVVVGQPGGEVLGASPTPSQRPSPTATATATASSSPEPTATPATPQPTAAPATPAPTPAPTAVPATLTPTPVPPPTPAPTATPIIMAALAPDETVELWYQYVEDGDFDAAYEMWSERMQRDYPRRPNLDNRWRDTRDITIEEISIAEQTATTAKVQIEFIETKENGESRRFIGWWDLIWTIDGWLLDHPNF